MEPDPTVMSSANDTAKHVFSEVDAMNGGIHAQTHRQSSHRRSVGRTRLKCQDDVVKKLEEAIAIGASDAEARFTPIVICGRR